MGDLRERRLEANRLLRESIDTLKRAQVQLERSKAVHARVTAYIEQYGLDRLMVALAHGALVDPAMGKGSQLAVRSANDHVEADLPCALVIKFDPRNKNVERRTDVRLLTGGTVQLNLDFGRAAG